MAERRPSGTGTGDPGQETWWSTPGLQRAWSAIAFRLEQEGLVARGGLRVGDLTPQEQRALTDLLGRTVLRRQVQIDLGRLDERLRTRAGTDVVSAAAHVLGRSLTDRPAQRAARAARADAPFCALDTWRDAHPDAASYGLDGRLDRWLAGLRRDGVLGRERDPVALVEDALAVLWHQREHLATGASGLAPSPVARTELAARLLGDAHALDDDRRLAAVLLRAARLLDPAVQGAEGADPEDSPAGSEAAEPPGAPTSSTREEWESLGVLTDRVSSTCLALGLRATGGSAAAQRVRGHADAWAVQHLTWRDLDEGLRFAADQTVLVCENPRVVEAAAELGPAGVALVSTSGRPALVTLEVLDRLRGAGARLHYHGDFDWAGVAMANDAVARFGAVPWRMAAADYLGLPGRLPLRGRRVEASWDPELAPAMAHRGLAVHEEAGLPELVQSFSELVATRRDNDSPLDEQRADGPLERAPRSRGSGRGVAERPCEDIP